MRILQVSGVFCDAGGGGVGDHVCSLGSRLVKLGHTVEVITHTRAPPKREHRGLVVHRVPISRIAGARYFQWGRDAGLFVKQLLKTTDFDLVHAHTTSMAFPLYYDGRPPLLITCHGTSVDPVHGIPRRIALAAIERRYYAKAARVIAVSETVKAELARRGVPNDHVEVIPNGTDNTRFEGIPRDKLAARALLGIKPDETVALFVGTLSERKGFGVLIQAMRRTLGDHQKPYHCLIAGDGPIGPQLRRLAASLPGVVALGFVQESVLGRLYSASDFLVCPSLYEGMPTVVLDALGFGLPVIASDIPSLREILTTDCAVFVRRNDPTSLSQAIECLGSSHERLMRMSEAAVKESKRFQWDLLVERLVRVYEQVTGWHQSETT